jgi:hypothetical protein
LLDSIIHAQVGARFKPAPTWAWKIRKGALPYLTG